MKYFVVITQGYESVEFFFEAIEDVLGLIRLLEKDKENTTTIKVTMQTIRLNAPEE